MFSPTRNDQRIIVFCTFLGLGLAIMVWARAQLNASSKEFKNWYSFPVAAPYGTPTVSQKSINLALTMFGIEVPSTAHHPVLNVGLEDRGLSSRTAWSDRIQVEIGPSAFASWGLLASTLAHELEVHCLQNFFLINVMDVLSLDGTGWAERQAYLHELSSAKRFGLEPENQELIRDTMNYYYQVNVGNDLGQKFAYQVGQTLTALMAKTPSFPTPSN